MRPTRNVKAPKRFDDFIVEVPQRKTRTAQPAAALTPSAAATTSSGKTSSKAPSKAPTESPESSFDTSYLRARSRWLAEAQQERALQALQAQQAWLAQTPSRSSPRSSPRSLPRSLPRSSPRSSPRASPAALIPEMQQAKDVDDNCPKSYTVYDPEIGKDIGGVYWGMIESAARAAFRRNETVKGMITPIANNNRQATFWFRLRNRKRNTVILYQVQVIQGEAQEKQVDNFERFMEQHVDCGENGEVRIGENIHTYMVTVLQGPIEIPAPEAAGTAPASSASYISALPSSTRSTQSMRTRSTRSTRSTR